MMVVLGLVRFAASPGLAPRALRVVEERICQQQLHRSLLATRRRTRAASPCSLRVLPAALAEIYQPGRGGAQHAELGGAGRQPWGLAGRLHDARRRCGLVLDPLLHPGR